ncbi:hypothetical protein E5288_WYG010228 [Bos mutus]|uniref:Large ribosomal subunit protein mL42 n=1 Tax=Bos mutus TaxID=72004 RepID=A0A6B0R725_9CETA|nr:hypothetical protein [Bos mutus]
MNPRSTPAVAAHPQPRHHGLLPAETTFPRVPRGPGRRVELCRLEPGLRQDGGFAVSSTSDGALYCVGHKSTYSSLPDDYNCKVELALTSDARTIVCYHPSVDIPYEHTKPIPRPDPVHNNEETHDLVLKTRLEEKSEHLEQGPMIEQLSKMFFTTKHRWYPRGQMAIQRVLLDLGFILRLGIELFEFSGYHRRRRKLNPPKDR